MSLELSTMQISTEQAEAAAALIADAGGVIIGFTKIQKLAYLLEISGEGAGFRFENRGSGPFSEELSAALETARNFGLITIEERSTTPGNFYTVYEAEIDSGSQSVSEQRRRVIEAAMETSPVTLEVATTAAWLASEQVGDPWGETARLKPAKATDKRIVEARRLMDSLSAVPALCALA